MNAIIDFTKAEIAGLGLNQLDDAELERAVKAFNGFVDLHGREWINKLFGNSKSPRMVRAISATWESWRSVRSLDKANTLIPRWREDINAGGVLAEVRLIASLVQNGCSVELFPEISGRVPDCRFRVGDEPWVYLEISARGLSEVRKLAQTALLKISTAAARSVPGKHGKVAILRSLVDEEIETVVAWLQQSPTHGSRFNDLAEFYEDDLQSAGPHPDLYKAVPGPAMFSTHLEMPGPTRRGTALIGISDSAAKKVLEREAVQLPRREIGVVILDLSQVIGGPKEWSPYIQRRFQPNLNTRISAVGLIRTVLAEEGFSKDEGEFLVNSHAMHPLPPITGALLARIIKE